MKKVRKDHMSKVLILDVETSPLVCYTWGLKDQNISVGHIKEDWFIMAWSAKWLGDPASKVVYRDQRNAKDVTDDRAILIPLWKMLDEADVVITQNGKRFDGPKLNARFIIHGFRPPSPYKHLDTYVIVKNAAAFTSNKLEYLTAKLCKKYKKISHGKYPGMSLWTECLKGNKEAWDEMKRYNILDVLSTEEFYDKIKAWAPKNSPDLFHSPGDCPVCGSTHVTRRGFDRTKSGKFQHLQCQSCGKWFRGDRIKAAA